MGGRIISYSVPEGKRSFGALDAVKEVERKIPNAKLVRITKVSEEVRKAQFNLGFSVLIRFVGKTCIVYSKLSETRPSDWARIGIGSLDTAPRKRTFRQRVFSFFFTLFPFGRKH